MQIIMAHGAIWLCMVLLVGLGSAADVPFVFDQSTSDVAGYTSAQIEQDHTTSPDLAGVPIISSPSDNESLEIPITGGGSGSGTQEKNIGELKKTLDARVEPDNPRVRDEAVVLALKYPGEKTIDQIVSIYDYLKNGDESKKGWGYVSDPRGIDDFMFANQTLRNGERANCVGGGDCDDFAILMSALVESIGGTTRIILARNNSTGGHAYTEVYLGRINNSDSGDQVEAIVGWLKEKLDADKIYTHIDTDTKDVWLNLDWGPDEKGSAHPGGPFYQGDKHIVLCIRDAFSRTPLRLPEAPEDEAEQGTPEISNKPPKLISLTADKLSPQEAGAAITWTAEARDPEDDQMLYRFYLNNEPATKWISEDMWTWTAEDYDTGENQIEVRIRDGKHASPDDYDDAKSVKFNLSSMKLMTQTWAKTFGGSKWDGGNSVKQTLDGGYIITGYTNSFGADEQYLWLIKTDDNGNMLWDKTFGKGKEHYVTSAVESTSDVDQTRDGGYITISYADSTRPGKEYMWLIKTDDRGNMLWDKTFGGSLSGRGYSVQQTIDGGYIITGMIDTGRDMCLIKTDDRGNKLWDRTYGESDDETSRVARQTDDGGYIIVGEKQSPGLNGYNYNYDVWLVKADDQGIKLWDKTFGGNGTETANSVQQTTDGGYIIIGATIPFGDIGHDLLLIKTDGNGNKQWDKIFEGDWGESVGFSVQQTTDGGYIITGKAPSLCLIKTDGNGNKLWENTFGNIGVVGVGHSVQQTTDGGYIITGNCFSSEGSDTDLCLIKTDAEGNV